jgi:hypothetical protein
MVEETPAAPVAAVGGLEVPVLGGPELGGPELEATAPAAAARPAAADASTGPGVPQTSQ